MHLLLLGVSHRTAPVDLRERIDFSATGIDRALAALAARPGSQEAVVLSTCNRAELYVACDDVPAARRELAAFLGEFHQVADAELAPHLYERTDLDAARHLFRVAAGLDSLVVGEPQILGQVKDAYAVAEQQQALGPLLSRLFHASFGVGKRVRSETALAAGAVSVSYAAVSLAKKIFGALADRSVLVIGAGEMGKLTAQHLKAQGIEQMTITSRTKAHADTLAATLGARAIPWDDLIPALTAADIAIAATGAPTPILTHDHVALAMKSRRNRPLFLIDIAVPRDVDPAVARIEQLFLYNIDDLQTVVQENLSKRAAEITSAERIVDEEVYRFGAWLRSRGVVPTIVALRQHFEAVRQAELKRPKVAALPPEARERVEEITRLLVEKLLLSPTEQLKALADPDAAVTHAEALGRLFKLTDEARGAGVPVPNNAERPQPASNPSGAAHDEAGAEETVKRAAR